MPAKQQKRGAMRLFCLLVLIFLSALSPLIAKPGDPDPGFQPPARLFKSVDVVLPMPDGKILVASGFREKIGGKETLLVKFFPDGRIDPAFDASGTGFEQIRKLRPTGDGKFLAVALLISDSRRNGVFRLNPDGSLDTTFRPEIAPEESIYDAAPAPGGKVVALLGFFGRANPESRLARFHNDGSIDPAFHPTKVQVRVMEELLVDPEGRIYLAGALDFVDGQKRVAVARLHPDGTLDEGYLLRDRQGAAPGKVAARTALLTAGGKLLLGGHEAGPGNALRGFFARLNEDGSVDASFNPPAFDRDVKGIATQANGKILLWGNFTSAGASMRKFLTRLDPDGPLDEGFLFPRRLSSAGPAAILADGAVCVWASVTEPPRGTLSSLWRLAADDLAPAAPVQVFAAENDVKSEGENAQFAVGVRAVPSATYQWQFNGRDLPGETNGILTLNGLSYQQMGSYAVSISNRQGAILSGAAHLIVNARPIIPGTVDTAFDARKAITSTVTALAWDGQGLLAGGNFHPRKEGSCTLMRLGPNGQLDESFLVGTGKGGVLACCAIDPQRGIYVGGSFRHYNQQARAGVARLGIDGRLDEGFVTRSAATNWIDCLLIQADGKLLIGGQLTGGDPWESLLQRLNVDGSDDPAFDARAAFPQGRVHALAAGPDGSIYAGGMGRSTGERAGEIHQLHADGSEAPGFRAPTWTNATVRSLVALKDGRLLAGVSGMIRHPGGKGFTSIVCLRSDGSPDERFPPVTTANTLVYPLKDGRLMFAGSGRFQLANANGAFTQTWPVRWSGGIGVLAEQPDGDLVVGGTFSQINGIPRLGLARLFSREQLPDPKLFGPFLTREGFRLSLPTVAGKQYHLEYKDSLAEPAWKPLGTVAGNGGWQDATDATPPGGSRFYQIRIE